MLGALELGGVPLGPSKPQDVTSHPISAQERATYRNRHLAKGSDPFFITTLLIEDVISTDGATRKPPRRARTLGGDSQPSCGQAPDLSRTYTLRRFGQG